MNLTLIAAIAKDNGIGLDGKLLWNLPADMAYFRKMTIGKTVLMGRKTYESIGKPLANRRNIVLSRVLKEMEGIEVLSNYSQIEHIGEEELMILGGAEVYALSMPLANRLIITEVHATFKADTFFPQIDPNLFECISESTFSADEKNSYSMTFKEYRRIEG